MIKEIQIENFKSIKKMKLELGRINVFIGENGSGKSNILEAIALAGAAAADKLDNEFLASRGIRASEPRHMRCALPSGAPDAAVSVTVGSDVNARIRFDIQNDNKPYSGWHVVEGESEQAAGLRALREYLVKVVAESSLPPRDNARSSDAVKATSTKITEWVMNPAHASVRKALGIPSMAGMPGAEPGDVREIAPPELRGFVIFSPENSSLRLFEREGQIEPLGIQGEGLLKFLQVLDADPEYAAAMDGIRKHLRALDWFDDVHIPSADSVGQSRIQIRDRYLGDSAGSLDQISSNEGFLFLLFYFSLFSTKLTPAFFAIDNVDASLNPKLCAHLVSELATLARENDKQAILTTHNPATLDGLDLNDDDQRLFVISRNEEGETRIKRIQQKEGRASTMKLSAAFIDGYLGGLPKNF